MWIRVEGGGSDNVDKDFFVFLMPFKGMFGILKAYLVLFCKFLPKTEKKFKYLQ
jgi:hypothetical protein